MHLTYSCSSDTLAAGNDIPTSQFSFSLDDGSAELYIGGANPDKYQGDFVWVDTAQDYWRVPTGGLSLNGQQLTEPGQFTESPQAIIDTGMWLAFRLDAGAHFASSFQQARRRCTDQRASSKTSTTRSLEPKTCLLYTEVSTATCEVSLDVWRPLLTVRSLCFAHDTKDGMPFPATFPRPCHSVSVPLICRSLFSRCTHSFPLEPVFGGKTFDIAPEDFMELGQVPTNPLYCIGGIIGKDGLPSEYLLYVMTVSSCVMQIQQKS
jgi:hypothetical protein